MTSPRLETDLPAPAADPTCTSSPSETRTGVHLPAVPPILASQVVGNAYWTLSPGSTRTPRPDLMVDEQATIAQLQLWVTHLGPAPRRAAELVARAFELSFRDVRVDVADRRTLIDGELGYWEVLARARLWDRSGITGPQDFLDALACEVQGTEENDIVRHALDDTLRLAHKYDGEAESRYYGIEEAA